MLGRRKLFVSCLLGVIACAATLPAALKGREASLLRGTGRTQDALVVQIAVDRLCSAGLPPSSSRTLASLASLASGCGRTEGWLVSVETALR